MASDRLAELRHRLENCQAWDLDREELVEMIGLLDKQSALDRDLQRLLDAGWRLADFCRLSSGEYFVRGRTTLGDVPTSDLEVFAATPAAAVAELCRKVFEHAT